MEYCRLGKGIYVFVILVLFSKDVLAKESITWLNFGQIPLYIDSGEYKGQGVIDNIINLIHDQGLEGFSPTYQSINHKRFDVIAREGDNCYFGWKTFSDERHFSKPVSIWFPMGIIVHKKNKHLFGETNTILSLKTLLEEKKLTLGVVDGFAYQQNIRTQLTKYENSALVETINTQHMQIELVMLSTRPIDYIIGWPFQPLVWEKLKGVSNDYLYYNIVEDQTYLYAGVSCSKTKKGEKVIELVNQLATQDEFLQKVQHYLSEWVFLTDQYNQLYQQSIIRNEYSPLVQHMEYK